jgi:glycogen debranching enzyme
MTESIQSNADFEILINSSLAESQGRVLKHGETFAVFDRQGEIRPFGFESHGIYHQGTRHLSHLVMRLQGKKPLLLSSTVKADNDLLIVDATNPDFIDASGAKVRGDTVHVFQSVFLWEHRCYCRVRLANYGLSPVEFSLLLDFDADFRDIFEVRGHKREKRGSLLEPVLKEDQVTLAYEGLDGLVRRTLVAFDPPPASLSRGRARFQLSLRPHEHFCFHVNVTCQATPGPSSEGAAREEVYERVFERRNASFADLLSDSCQIETSNEFFNAWLQRSRVDILMMLTQTPEGLYPYAGIPWYSTIFGRDGILTALSVLTVNPRVAEGVLGYLANHQAQRLCPERDAEPGKILHEVRKGEMANLREIPFDFYYGSVDATPLFILLSGRYFERTQDLSLIARIWPAIERALGWIDQFGDLDGDGFVEYVRKSKDGLTQQGWKDSDDAIFHAGGEIAEPPIALAEVQGYVYEAKQKAAMIARALGKGDLAARLSREAIALRERFRRRFWCEDLGAYALALDGHKRPCRVRSSNAGQCLFSGIAAEDHAERITEMLMGDPFFSGWGVRTVASTEVRYNPMSYHNGSVWPHDNALIASGMSRYGFKSAALRILTGLFEASLFVDLHRLPEVFCGFGRRPGEGPTLYPVACNPQAWASASVYLLLDACLGLSVEIEGESRKVRFRSPTLPEFLNEVRITNLEVATGRLDIVLKRHGQDVSIQVTRRGGDAEVVETR